MAEIKPILAGKGLDRVRRLGLMNAEFADALCAALPRAKILPQLELLNLSMGTMSDEGAQHLLKHAAAFAHLKRLDLSDNFISDDLAKKLKSLCAEVDTGEQGDPEYRYVTVGE